VARHPHDKFGCAGEETSVLEECGLCCFVDGDEEVGDVETDWVPFEEVREVDEVVFVFGNSVGYEFVVLFVGVNLV